MPNLHKWWKTQEQKELYGGDRVSSGTESSYKITDYGWHTYGMLWTPNEISLFVDGECYMSYNLNENFSNDASAAVGMADFQNPLCIILNNHLFTPAYTGAAGGAWAVDYTVNDAFSSAVFDIDYVRLYQKPNFAKWIEGVRLYRRAPDKNSRLGAERALKEPVPKVEKLHCRI